MIYAYLRVIHVRYTRGKSTVYMVLYAICYMAIWHMVHGCMAVCGVCGLWCRVRAGLLILSFLPFPTP